MPVTAQRAACRYEFQLTLGRKLARKIEERGWDIDCIVPVPDGSRPAAIELSAELNLPYREGLVKNRYVGRTFIMPDQRTRELSVKRKLNAMPAVFSGKKVLLVDDSIVRGTTMSQIVDMVRKAGAAQVYLASASPAVKYPNVYGVPNPSLATVHYMDLSHLQVVRHHGINLELCKCVDAEGRGVAAVAGNMPLPVAPMQLAGCSRSLRLQVWTFPAEGSLLPIT